LTAESPVVLITGASSGIGLSTAEAFSRRGARLVLASRSPLALNSAADRCREIGGEIFVVPTDVGDGQAVDALFAAAVDRFGRVDVVVHAAAAVAYGRFVDVPAEVFDKVLTTNLTGTANVSRAALRQFTVAGGGRLVLVGSLLGKIAVPLMSPYVTSKWAVHGLARMIQIEAREMPGVAVTVVSPGSVNTPAYHQAANYAGRKGRPPPPVDRPEKVAAAIVRSVRRPRRERSVGIANGFVVTGFRLLPGVYDLLVLPLVKAAALSREPTPASSGSVLEPQPAGEAVHGPWNRQWLRPTIAGAVLATAAGAAAAVRLRSR
jgi:NAD(P)-dependent dehydrogenase (short-subunit alcohol dehydrogenase family)